MNRILIFMLVAFTLPFSQETSSTRIWHLSDFSRLTGVFQWLDDGLVSLKDEQGQLHYVPFRELTPDDQTEVMRASGWGRVWQDDTGKFRIAGDLVRVESTNVVLENIDGDHISVPFDRLSQSDRAYAESQRQNSAEVLPERFVGKIVSITDGDSVTVLINNRQFKIRLEGIDAPEIGQAFGSKAKHYLSDLIGEQVVSGVRLGTDKYSRNLCRLSVNGIEVNTRLVEQGFAWHYEKYSDDLDLAKLQQTARELKRNLWSEQLRVPPWDWRKLSGSQRKNHVLNHLSNPPKSKPLTTKITPKNKPAKSSKVKNLPLDSKLFSTSRIISSPNYQRPSEYWLNTDTFVRHNPGCRWFHKTQQGRPCGANEGNACGNCGGAP